MEWNMNFIKQEDYKKHVKEYFELISASKNASTVEEFNRNIIDPIKMTFIYFTTGENKEFLIESELNRQVDKTINNHIGYFHQNLFNYIEGWHVPQEGFDIAKNDNTVFVELKNKHNTMNSSSSQKTYMNMQNKVIDSLEQGEKVTCMLVEVIAKRSQNVAWQISLNKVRTKRESIRRVSIDKFWEFVTGDKYAFQKLMSWLPITLKSVLTEKDDIKEDDLILKELTKEAGIFKSLYKLAFGSYEGFENIQFKQAEQLSDDFK